ncbi:hypothetical protein [Flavobacterium beibuense]|uniref:Uncharacterized protein n=1 Tax=Flavobacterium beibuense TaxID=657326 RepID=A0A444WC14_9FLAO|nr:hypothetical protein [Flavobacterium beibuense]RYJ43355.1 hypothetical protein NU09_1693 [Flavobacterium beibuense]
MKLTKLLVIPVLFATAALSAQQTTYNYNNGQIGAIYSKKADSQPAQGSQYYNEKFLPGKVDDANEVSMIRYNAYSDEIEVQVNNEILVLQPKDNQTITLSGDKGAYKYLQFTDKENVSSQRYLIPISENDKVNIYKKENIYLQPEEHPTSGYGSYKAPMYRKKDLEYYIQLNNGDIVYMSTKKKDVTAIIPGKEKEIKNFIKENKIDTDEDEDLKTLGAYLNTLL